MTLKIFRGDEPDNSTSTDSDHYLGQYIPLHYHHHMLQDHDRTSSFRKAIEAVVKPCMNVVELGCGTGILSSFAARQGAQVTCIERNPALIACTERLSVLNQIADRLTIIQQDATRFIPTHHVDVVICEMLHVGMLREQQLAVIEAFKRNYLQHIGPPLPIFIPEVSLLTIQLVEQCFEFEGYYAPVPIFQSPAAETNGTTELSSPCRYSEIIYNDAFPQSFNWQRKIRVERSGCVNAIRLLTQNLLHIDVKRSESVNWANQFLVLPLTEPFQANVNEMVPVSIQYSGGDDLETFQQNLQVSLPATRRQQKAA